MQRRALIPLITILKTGRFFKCLLIAVLLFGCVELSAIYIQKSSVPPLDEQKLLQSSSADHGLSFLWDYTKLAYAKSVTQQPSPTTQPEEETLSEAVASQAKAAEPTFGGRWYTHIAIIDLDQVDEDVTGTVSGYDDNWTFDVTGTIDGNILIIEPTEALGEFILTLSEDGTALGGDPSDPMQWCGVREGSLPDGCGYSGIWSVYSEGDSPVQWGNYFELTQTEGTITGSLVSYDETVRQPVEGTVRWEQEYRLELAEGDILGAMTWGQNGTAFGTSPTGDEYKLQINLATTVSPFVPTAFERSPASIVDREDAPLALPAPLYFLNSDGQIMHLDPVQFEAVQLTNEVEPILSFDVARTHSGLAYVTDKQLIELDLISGKRTLLVDGTPAADAQSEDEWTEQLEALGQPRYSPDGTQIVYLHDGVWLVQSLMPDQSADVADRARDKKPQPQLVIANEQSGGEYSNLNEVRLYNSATWSPSGQYFLLSFGVWEGNATEIWDIAAGEPLADELFWLSCCDASWGADDETVVAGSSALVYGQPGLFQVDVRSAELTTLLDGNPNQSQLTLLAQGAHQSQSGEIFVLLDQTTMEQSESKRNRYSLHQISEDGDITSSNPSGVGLARELLWAEDDSGIVVADQDALLQWLPVEGETVTNLFISGTNLRWGSTTSALDKVLAKLPTQAFPTRSLQKQAAIDFGPAEEGADEENLSSSEQMIATRYLARPKEFINSSASDKTNSDETDSDETDSDEADRDETDSDEANSDETDSDEADSDETDSDEANSDEANSDEVNSDETDSEGPIWAAYSTGIRNSPSDGHWIALYMQDGSDWRLIEQIQFPVEIDVQVESGPNYLSDGSVEPVTFSRDRYWLGLKGGTDVTDEDVTDGDVTDGDVADLRELSTLYYLLSFDGQELKIEAEGFSNSGNADWLDDADFDGVSDYLVVDNSDYSVFCSTCGVRRIQYNLLRWDGLEMVPVTLTQFDEENSSDTITPQMSEINNSMVQFVEAGLWKDAQALMPEYRELMQSESDGEEPPQRVEILDDNMAFLRLHLGDIQQEIYNPESAYPLLANIFFGDYGSALNLVRPQPQNAVFSQNSPLIIDSVAEGWEEALAENILVSTDAALSLAPERAEIYFFKGWANWLLGDIETASASLTEANKLDPDDLIYREALLGLQASTGSSTALSAPSIEAQANMNLRTGPGTQYERIGSLAAGKSALVLGKSADAEWWQILDESSGRQLWVSANPAYTTASNVRRVAVVGLEATSPDEIEPTVAPPMSTPTATVSSTTILSTVTPTTTVLSTVAPTTTVQSTATPTTTVQSTVAPTTTIQSTATPTTTVQSTVVPTTTLQSTTVLESERSTDASPPSIARILNTQATTVVISSDDTLLATGENSGVSVWDTSDWIQLWTEADSGEVKTLAFSADGERLIIGRQDGVARLLNARTGLLVAEYNFSQSIEEVDFNADGSVVAMGGFDGDLIIADGVSGNIQAELNNALPVQNLALSSSGPWVAAMTAGSQDSVDLIVWDFRTEEKRSLISHSRLPNHSNVAFSPDDQWVAGAVESGGPVRVWQTQTWTEVAALEAGAGSVSQVLFDRSSTQLAVYSSLPEGTEIVIWDVASWEESQRIVLPNFAWDMAFGPDSRYLAVGLGQNGRNEAQILEIATGIVTARLPHSGQVTSVKFSSDGQWIATSGGTSAVQIWSLNNLR